MRTITKHKLASAPLYKYKSKIRIKDIYPDYFQLLKLFRVLRSENESTNTTKACAGCCHFGSCSLTSNTCPCMATGCSTEELQKRLRFEQVTLQKVLDGEYPFGFINKIRKYKIDPDIYRRDEFRNRDDETILTYTSNPFMHIADYKLIINQLNNNVFPDQMVINHIEDNAYFYIYKKLILSELAAYGLLGNVNGMTLSEGNCVQCEIANTQSPLCKCCQLASDQTLHSYYNKGSSNYPIINNWNNPCNNNKTLTDASVNGIIYVWMKPVSGMEQELCSMNANVTNVVNYGLFLSKKRVPHSFPIFGVKR